jgi:hypothetical protein
VVWSAGLGAAQNEREKPLNGQDEKKSKKIRNEKGQNVRALKS